MQIRETNPQDLEEILRHRRYMFRDMGHTDEVILDGITEACRPWLKRYLDEGTYRGWFAIASHGKVAAGAGLTITPLLSGPLDPQQIHRVYLLNVYTYPEFRRQRLARTLTERAIEWCRGQGFKLLWLHASEYGRPIYDSLGFQPTNEMKLIIE